MGAGRGASQESAASSLDFFFGKNETEEEVIYHIQKKTKLRGL
jgi:hypothetical protein